MSIDQHVSVTIVVNNSGLAQQGFGTAAFLGYNTAWSEKSRAYRRAADAVADGLASDSPEVRFIAAVTAQSPRPPLVKILRGTRPPTQQYRLAATAVANTKYQVDVSGTGVTDTPVVFTSDSTPTLSEIHNSLITQLTAVDGAPYTVTQEPTSFSFFSFVPTGPGFDVSHAVAHGRITGEGPVHTHNVGGALPGGLAEATPYFIIAVGPDDLSFATSRANALAGIPINVTSGGTGANTIQEVTESTTRPDAPILVTADDPGDWFNLSVSQTASLSVSQTHDDPGVADDLDEIVNEDADWYYLYTAWNSRAVLMAAADWTESEEFKFYVGDTQDSVCENTVDGPGDVGHDVAALSYTRSLVDYRRRPEQMHGARWIGTVAPLPVGTWTAAYKTPAGSSADKFTTQQIINLDARKVSYFKVEAGRSITWEGKLGSPSFLFADVRVSLDFMLDLIQKNAFSLLVSRPKLAYVDEDIAMMEARIQAAIDVGASDAHKIVAKGTPGDPNDPQPTVRLPRVRQVDPSVRALRKLPDGEVFFRLQGAIHTVDVGVTVVF